MSQIGEESDICNRNVLAHEEVLVLKCAKLRNELVGASTSNLREPRASPNVATPAGYPVSTFSPIPYLQLHLHPIAILEC